MALRVASNTLRRVPHLRKAVFSNSFTPVSRPCLAHKYFLGETRVDKHNFHSTAICHSIGEVITLNESKVLSVKWSDGHLDEFPAVFLRDNCQCPDCFQPSSRSRVFLMRNLDLEINFKTAKADPTNENVEITWPDGHQSVFSASFLKSRSFSEANLNERKQLASRTNFKLWGPSYEIRRHKFSSILESDHVLLSWLTDLEEYGLTIVEDVPKDRHSIRVISKRVAFLKLTHYGVDFIVRSKADANNPAYTSKTLGLHIDLPYYEYMPGVQLLHCLDQTKGPGGENEFVDGFNIAKIIRENAPDSYKVLTTMNVDFIDEGTDDISGEFCKTLLKPIFTVDEHEDVYRVRYSNVARGSHMPGNVEKTMDYYKAIKLFDKLAHDPQNMIVYKLEEGECVVFNNQRVLHGRKGYTQEPGEERWLMGGYIDWDEIRSRRNVLIRNLNSK